MIVSTGEVLYCSACFIFGGNACGASYPPRANTRRDEALKLKAKKLPERSEQALAIELKEPLHRGHARRAPQPLCCLLKRMRRN